MATFVSIYTRVAIAVSPRVVASMVSLLKTGAPDKPCGEDARMLTQKLLLNDT